MNVGMREAIDVALLDLFANHASVKGKFAMVSRVLTYLDETARESLPALFLDPRGESWIKTGKGIPAKRTLQRVLILYDFTPSRSYDEMPSTLVNDLLDVVDVVIEQPGNPQNVQTLGGLCEHVYIEGEVRIDTGLMQDRSVVEVPLTVLLP